MQHKFYTGKHFIIDFFIGQVVRWSWHSIQSSFQSKLEKTLELWSLNISIENVFRGVRWETVGRGKEGEGEDLRGNRKALLSLKLLPTS